MAGLNLVVISGLSGSGKSHALKCLEDVGYFCTDILPPALLPAFVELCHQQGGEIKNVALGIDVRERVFFSNLVGILGAVRDKVEQTITYKNAWIEMFGVPILYTPYFRHPDFGVDRQSGFLSPAFHYSTESGAQMRVPYFLVLGPDKDMTFSPILRVGWRNGRRAPPRASSRRTRHRLEKRLISNERSIWSEHLP